MDGVSLDLNLQDFLSRYHEAQLREALASMTNPAISISSEELCQIVETALKRHDYNKKYEGKRQGGERGKEREGTSLKKKLLQPVESTRKSRRQQGLSAE